MWATMVIDNIEQFDCLCKSKIATEEEKNIYRRKTQLANNQYYKNNKTDKLLIKKIRHV